MYDDVVYYDHLLYTLSDVYLLYALLAVVPKQPYPLRELINLLLLSLHLINGVADSNVILPRWRQPSFPLSFPRLETLLVIGRVEGSEAKKFEVLNFKDGQHGL